jgi:hypothetical protein
MSRRVSPTQKEISRAIKATQEAGLAVAGVEIDGTKIIVLTVGGKPASQGPTTEDLDRELEEWESKQRGHH